MVFSMAKGTMAAPDLVAIFRLPGLNGRMSPLSERVPSGKMHMPCSFFFNSFAAPRMTSSDLRDSVRGR